MRTSATLVSVAGAMALWTFAAFAQPRGGSPADNQDIVERFLSGGGPLLTEYRAVRRLEARNERFHAEGWLEACTALIPGRGFQYRVMGEGGSGLIRDRVLEKALKSEREAWATGEVLHGALVPANYEFQATDDPDGDLRKVRLRPRRKSRVLVDGAMFLTPIEGDLVRVHGMLAGRASFWTRRVEVVRHYERIVGVRVPVALESIADVRMAGQSSFHMTYHYLSVNGRALGEEHDSCGGPHVE